ncbi:hypothetical protein AOLI_G00050680 [Acnodon oligacanthus]
MHLVDATESWCVCATLRLHTVGHDPGEREAESDPAREAEREGEGERERGRGMARLLQQAQQAGTSQGQQHTSTWIIALSHSASRQRITSQPDAERRRGVTEREELR